MEPVDIQDIEDCVDALNPIKERIIEALRERSAPDIKMKIVDALRSKEVLAPAPIEALKNELEEFMRGLKERRERRKP